METQLQADVVVIGGGITGVAIARELSRYQIDTILVEKGGELCAEQTKATWGVIYQGAMMSTSMLIKSFLAPDAPLYEPHSLKIRWCEEGFKEWPIVCKDLDVKCKPLNYLLVADDDAGTEFLNKVWELGQSIGGIYADMRRVDKEEILAIEPNANQDIIDGIFAQGHALDVFPPEAVMAMAENAIQNGCQIILEAEVTGVSHSGDYQVVATTKGLIKTNFIINAAGKHADIIADMGGARDWGLQFFKAQPILLDRRTKGLVNSIFCLINGGGTIMPRDENTLIQCSSYQATENREDTATTRDEFIDSIARARKMFPAVSTEDVITSFGAIRVYNVSKNPEDHIVEFSSTNPRFLNVAIRLPGLIGAFPMARHVVGMLADAGLKLVSNPHFNPHRQGIPRFRELSNDERAALIARDPRYGHVVCRCEMVTEGEIVEAIRRGARTEEGIKMRTRAGMGRCQRGFCGPRVINILSRELNIPVTKVTKRSADSPFLLYRSKELLSGKRRVT